jgi:hypothetical protein
MSSLSRVLLKNQANILIATASCIVALISNNSHSDLLNIALAGSWQGLLAKYAFLSLPLLLLAKPGPEPAFLAPMRHVPFRRQDTAILERQTDIPGQACLQERRRNDF